MQFLECYGRVTLSQVERSPVLEAKHDIMHFMCTTLSSTALPAVCVSLVIWGTAELMDILEG